MKILGRNIKLKKIVSLIKKHPTASFIQALQKIRQTTLLDYKLLKGHSFPPFMFVFEVSHRCNLRCKTCWFYGKSGLYKIKKPEQELNFKEIKKFIDQISYFKPYLLITGGEPLLHDNIFEIINYAEKKGIFTGMITNGMLVNKNIAKKIINSKLDFITISIDGPEDIHNKARNSKFSFTKTIEAIKHLNNEKKSIFPLITINTTISDLNYNNLNNLVRIAEENNVDILQFQHQWFSTPQISEAHNKQFKKLFNIQSDFFSGFENDMIDKININILKEQIKNINSKKVDIRFYPDLKSNELEGYYKSFSRVFNDKCTNPWFSTIITPNGDISPCLDFKIGNIKDDFKKTWNNKKIKQFRLNLKNKKYFMGCLRCCGFFQK
ncbi:MAG: radical SAM protein [Nanoarchaeota archaeon]|nr:radical SAM protein [Nanoarchaeota archaeon]